jgi:tRNA U34 5-carboxymethylaminomethyl modifying GTPase MnmE/TrmE
VSYGILCHYGNFLDDTSYEEVNNIVMDDGMISSIGQNPTFTCQHLVMKTCHGGLKFWMNIHLVGDNNRNTIIL